MDNKFKTWGEFAKNYDLVLFNKCIELDDGAVSMEWYENHKCDKESDEEGCQCEVFQWYAINVSEWSQEYLNKTYNLDIFYSDTLDLYILPVYHFGTGWDCVNI